MEWGVERTAVWVTGTAATVVGARSYAGFAGATSAINCFITTPTIWTIGSAYTAWTGSVAGAAVLRTAISFCIG